MRSTVLLCSTLVSSLCATFPACATDLNKDTHRTAGYFSRASAAGAALNADRLKGGGTDDTAALQAVLDRAAGGRPVHLLIDGVALVRGLDVYGNTTIECMNGGGLYLKDRSSRAIIRNAHRSRDAVVDEHIAVRGCFLNGNRAQQPGTHPELEPHSNNQEADGTFITGLQFLGINYLTVENVVLWNVRAFGALIGNGSRIDIRNLTVDHGAPPDIDWEYLQADGLQFKGPMQYVTIDGLKLRTGDDGLAFNADDMLTDDLTIRNEAGPYVRHGPILDVTVTNVHFMDSLFGVRFLSAKQRIDRVVISNVTGTINGPRLAVISNYTGPGNGNIGTIEFNNVTVDRSRDATFVSRWLPGHMKLIDRNRPFYDENNGGVPTFFNVNCNVERLRVHNFNTSVTDDRPIIRLGPSAHVQQMSVEMNLLDAQLQAIPLELDEGARIERLSFSLEWSGKDRDVSKSPIAYLGGTIDELRWIDTPPRYVDALIMGRNSLLVKLSQQVKAADYSAGARVTVNDNPARIVRAFRDSTRLDSVHYEIDRPLGSDDVVSWAYDAASGSIRNMDGNDLLSIAPKPVSEQPARVSAQ